MLYAYERLIHRLLGKEQRCERGAARSRGATDHKITVPITVLTIGSIVGSAQKWGGNIYFKSFPFIT